MNALMAIKNTEYIKTEKIFNQWFETYTGFYKKTGWRAVEPTELIINNFDMELYINSCFDVSILDLTAPQAFNKLLVNIITGSSYYYFHDNRVRFELCQLSNERLYYIIQNYDFTAKQYGDNPEEIRLKLEQLDVYKKKGMTQDDYNNYITQKVKREYNKILKNEHYVDCCFNRVNENRPYASTYSINIAKFKIEDRQKYLTTNHIYDETENKLIPLIDVVRTISEEQAEKINISKSIEKIAQQKKYKCLFITFTLPPRFHPNPSNQNSSWTGLTINDGHKYFTTRWARIRTSLNDRGIEILGINVNELHKDSCLHYHCLCYIDETNIPELQKLINRHFNESHVDFKVIEKTDDSTCSPSSYIFKYVIKTLGLDCTLQDKIENNTLTAEDNNSIAHWFIRSIHKIRGFNCFGIERKMTAYRQFMKTRFNDDISLQLVQGEIRQSATGFAEFLNLTKSDILKLIRNEKDTVVGIVINGVEYLKRLYIKVGNVEKIKVGNIFKPLKPLFLVDSTIIVNCSSKSEKQTQKQKPITLDEDILNIDDFLMQFLQFKKRQRLNIAF